MLGADSNGAHMKRIAIVLLSGLMLSACNDVTEPERGLVAVKSAPANTLIPEITITDIGDGEPHAINELGQVVGAGFGTGTAFLWHNGVMTDLGTLPGDNRSSALARVLRF
jgi:probable HAF family extracellular repeat protein